MMIMDSNEYKSMKNMKNSIKFYPILSMFLFLTTFQQSNCFESSNQQHSLLNQSSQVQIEYIDNEIQNQKYSKSKPTVAPSSFNKNLQYPPVYIPSTTTTTIRPKVIFADCSTHSRQTAFHPINQSSVIYFTENDKRPKSSSVIYENLAPKFENSKVVFDDDEDDNSELREELVPGFEIDNQEDENDDENENKEHRPIVFVIKNPSLPDGAKPNKLYLNKNGNAEMIDIGQNQQQLLINTVVDLNRRLAKLRKKNLQLKKIKNSDNNKSRKKIIRRLSNDKNHNNKGKRRKVVIKKKKLIRARPQQQPIMLISEDGPSVDHPNAQRFIIESNHDSEDDEDSDSMDSNHEEDKLIPLNSSNSKIKKNERLLEYFRKKQQKQQSAPPPIPPPPPPPEIVNQPQVVNVQYSSGPEGDNSKIPAEYQPWQPLAPIAQMPLMANVYWRKIVFPTVPIMPAVLANNKDIGGGVATSQSTSSTSSIDSAAATLDQGRLHRTNLATITEPSSSSSFAKTEGNNSIIDNKNSSGKTRKKYIIYYVRNNNNQQNNNPIIINGTDSNESSQLNDQVDWNSDDEEEENGDEHQPESKQSEQPESNGSKTVIRKDPTATVNLKQEKMLKSLLKLIQKQNLNNNNRKNSMVTYEENDQLDNNDNDGDDDNEELTLQTQNPYNNGDKQKWIFPDASKPNQLLKIVKQAPKSSNVQQRLQKIQSAKSNQPIKLIIRRNRKIIRPKMAPPPPPSVIHRTRPRSYARRYRHLAPPTADNYRPRIRKRIRTVRIIKV